MVIKKTKSSKPKVETKEVKETKPELRPDTKTLTERCIPDATLAEKAVKLNVPVEPLADKIERPKQSWWQRLFKKPL